MLCALCEWWKDAAGAATERATAVGVRFCVCFVALVSCAEVAVVVVVVVMEGETVEPLGGGVMDADGEV